MSGLTSRQREVLVLVANGNTNAVIARHLGVGSATVIRHLSGAYRSLGARDRAQAVALALRGGELRLDEVRVPVVAQAPSGAVEEAIP